MRARSCAPDARGSRGSGRRIGSLPTHWQVCCSSGRHALGSVRRLAMQATLDHLNLSVRDLEETIAWYAKVFGFAPVERGTDEQGPWAILRNGDAMLCAYQRAGRAAPRSTPDAERHHLVNHFGLRLRDRARWERTVHEEALRTYHGSP